MSASVDRITPSAGGAMPPTSDFADARIVPSHNAQAVHTFSNRERKYVFIYCTEPGNIETIAVTRSYSARAGTK
jgi:hypothetical protein